MWPHQPLRKDAYSVRKSAAGLGLYAEQPIKKGQKIIEYIGERISTAEADRRGGKYLFTVNSRITIDGTARYNTARYINHSCGPNAEPRENAGRIYAYAIKNIEAWEEITYDYWKEYWNFYIKPYGCRCDQCMKKSVKKSASDKKSATKKAAAKKTENKTDKKKK